MKWFRFHLKYRPCKNLVPPSQKTLLPNITKTSQLIPLKREIIVLYIIVGNTYNYDWGDLNV